MRLGRKVHFIAGLWLYPAIIALFIPDPCLAWELPSTPPTNSADSDRPVLPMDFTVESGDDKSLADLTTAQPPRVRIGLRLVPYRKLLYSGERGPETKFKPDQAITHTLRARMDRPNHFFLGEYHIETNPIAWDKQAGIYKIKLNFFRRFGSYGQIEESIGALELNGRLKGAKGLYVIHGLASAQFKDKRGQPVVDLIAGYAEKKNTDLSDRNLAKGQASAALDQAKVSLRSQANTDGEAKDGARGSVRINPVAQPTLRNKSNPWQKL